MLRLIAACCLILVGRESLAGESATEVPIPVTFGDLRNNQVLESGRGIEGKVIRIVGWCDQPALYDERFPEFTLRPERQMPDSLPPTLDWVIVEPHVEVKRAVHDSRIEVIGTFVLEETLHNNRVVAAYRIIDARIQTIEQEEVPVKDPIEIAFWDLQAGILSNKEGLREPITSIEGKLVRIVGRCGSPDQQNALWLRPNEMIYWIPPYNVGIAVEPHGETTLPPPDNRIEVTGIFASEEVRYRDQVGFAHRIKDARIKVIEQEEDPVDESIEVGYDDLRWNGELGMLPKRVAEIEGKLVRIVGWCDGSHPDDEDYPIVELRPDNIVPDWAGARVDWVMVNPKKPRRIRPDTLVEVRGIFTFREGTYRIGDAEIKVMRHYRD